MPEILSCCRCSRDSLRPLGPTRPQGPILALVFGARCRAFCARHVTMAFLNVHRPLQVSRWDEAPYWYRFGADPSLEEWTEARRQTRRLIHHLTSQRRQAEIPHWAREIDHWPIHRVCDWLGNVTDEEIPPTWLRVASQVNLAHLALGQPVPWPGVLLRTQADFEHGCAAPPALQTPSQSVALMPLPPPPPPDTAPEAPLAITDAVASSLRPAVAPLAGLAVTMPAMPPADAGHATELGPSPEIQAASQAAAAASAEAACPWHRYVASEGPYAPCGSCWWHNEITDECFFELHQSAWTRYQSRRTLQYWWFNETNGDWFWERLV